MAGMIKLVLLMTLAAVFFLPENGVNAVVTRCYGRDGGENEKDRELTCNELVRGSCMSTTGKRDGKYATLKNCNPLPKSSFPGLDSNGCSKKVKIQDVETQFCVCDTDLCNSTGRLHGQFSSVLSLCVISIFLAISFFGKP